MPQVGLEPTHLAVPDFESGASTNSTTGALDMFISGLSQFASLFFGLLGAIFTKKTNDCTGLDAMLQIISI